MADFHVFTGDEVIATDLPNLLNTNFNSIRSDFAGTSFPTQNLIEGMTCYRTDLNVAYRYIGGEWVKDIDLSNYVTLDGTQEISGAKKFTGNTTLVGNVYVPVSTTIQFFQNNPANLRGSLTSTNYTGNAATATKLATARTITLSGDVNGSVSFNGSKDVTIETTLSAFNDEGHLVLPSGVELW